MPGLSEVWVVTQSQESLSRRASFSSSVNWACGVEGGREDTEPGCTELELGMMSLGGSRVFGFSSSKLETNSAFPAPGCSED
jgi:hypothetical protein